MQQDINSAEEVLHSRGKESNKAASRINNLAINNIVAEKLKVQSICGLPTLYCWYERIKYLLIIGDF